MSCSRDTQAENSLPRGAEFAAASPASETVLLTSSLSLADSLGIYHRYLERLACPFRPSDSLSETSDASTSSASTWSFRTSVPLTFSVVSSAASRELQGSHRPSGSPALLVDSHSSSQSWDSSVAQYLQMLTRTSLHLHSSHHCPKPTTRSVPARLWQALSL